MPATRLCLMFASTMLLACGSSAAGKAPGSLVKKELSELDDATTVTKRWSLMSQPGETLVVRVRWTVTPQPKADEQPFGEVEVSLDDNQVGATEVSCTISDPVLQDLPAGQPMWSVGLSCDYEYAKGSGSDHIATVWARGILETG